MKFRLISALLKQTWAIDERYAIAHGGIISGMFNGLVPIASEGDIKEIANALPYALASSNPSRKYSAYDSAPKGSIAVIPVRGPLMKEDQDDCGYFSAGMATLAERVREADAHENIDSILLYIDSPGGTSDGTQAFADAVAATGKPVIAFVDGLMASAAMWVGSAANEIIAQNSTTEIGSIGVKCSFQDMQPKWEAEGVKFHSINADQCPDKNKDFTDALKGDYKAIKENMLNPLAIEFRAAIQKNRPNASEEVFTGKVYYAKDALKLGLIDEIGSFDFALTRAQELAVNHKKDIAKANVALVTTKPIMNQKTKTEMKSLTLLTALLAVGALEVTDDGVFLNASQLEAIEDRLAADASVIQLSEQAKTAADTQTKRITELEGELAEVRKLPGANTATVIVAADIIVKEDINTLMESMTMSERIAYLKKQD